MFSKPLSCDQSIIFGPLAHLDHKEPLLHLGNAIDWKFLEDKLKPLYSQKTGRNAKPIRLMCALLMLKQLYNLSDENVVMAMKFNAYFQVFAGFNDFQIKRPCCPTMLVKFRQRIGTEGVAAIFAASVKLHGEAAEEKTVIVDTIVQEKAITYPTDSKLALNIINRLNKLAKKEGIQQRRTYAKTSEKITLGLKKFPSSKATSYGQKSHEAPTHLSRDALKRI